jgi:sensor histidine kinase YesM
VTGRHEALRSAGRAWAAAFAAATAFGVLDALPDTASPLALWQTLLPWYGWALLAPVVLALAERFPLGRAPRWRGMMVHLAAGVGLSVLKLVALLPLTRVSFGWREQGVGIAEGLGWLLAHRLPGNVIMYFLFAAAATALVEQRRARAQEVMRARLAAELAESELRLLRAQLEPHFLFNALNAVTAFVRVDPPRAERMLGELSELLRLVLHAARAEDVSLEEELRIAERYAAVHRLRFGDALAVRVDANPELRALRVPGIVLQPLIENAVRHAANASPGAEVRVRAHREGDRLVLSVANTRAPGGGAHQGTGSGQAVGLANTRARLARIYGAAASVELRDEAECTVAEIRVPLTPPAGGTETGA